MLDRNNKKGDLLLVVTFGDTSFPFSSSSFSLFHPFRSLIQISPRWKKGKKFMGFPRCGTFVLQSPETQLAVLEIVPRRGRMLLLRTFEHSCSPCHLIKVHRVVSSFNNKREGRDTFSICKSSETVKVAAKRGPLARSASKPTILDMCRANPRPFIQLSNSVCGTRKLNRSKMPIKLVLNWAFG